MEPNSARPNSQSSCKRVHYSENSDLTHNEGDNCSVSSSPLSKSLVDPAGINSDISVTTAILDAAENEIETLKKQLDHFEYKVKYLEKENCQINQDLLAEKQKSSKLEKKLQFVKDNQEVFMRLKEAYINMKYNEAAGRKMIEIRERGLQTWGGAICSSCIESEELRRQIAIITQKYSELFVISPGEMEHLINTVTYLRDLISRREEAWAYNLDNEHQLQSRIALLECENMKLKQEQKPSEQETQKLLENVTKEIDKLKRIIVKYEKHFREVKLNEFRPLAPPLSGKELKIVQQVLSKYNSQRNADEESKSVNDMPKSQTAPSIVKYRHYRKGSTCTESSDGTKGTSASFDRPKSAGYTNQTERAIMMIETLFD